MPSSVQAGTMDSLMIAVLGWSASGYWKLKPSDAAM